jgi:hypothetical protein
MTILGDVHLGMASLVAEANHQRHLPITIGLAAPAGRRADPNSWRDRLLAKTPRHGEIRALLDHATHSCERVRFWGSSARKCLEQRNLSYRTQ